MKSINVVATALFLLIVTAVPVLSQEVVVIINGEVSSISSSELEQVFLGRRTSLGSTRVTIATLASGAAHEAFLSKYLSRQPQQFTTYWKQKVFTGQGKMPAEFKSDSEMIEYVEKNPGAIGYISAGSKGSVKGSVKVIAIE